MTKPDTEPVTTIEDFIKKHNIRGLNNLCEEFFRKCPPFEEESEFAKKFGVIVADLESALIHYKNSSRK